MANNKPSQVIEAIQASFYVAEKFFPNISRLFCVFLCVFCLSFFLSIQIWLIYTIQMDGKFLLLNQH